MTILSKLTLTDTTKASMLTSPKAKLRGKMLEALDLQIEAAKAMLDGETYIRRAMRWVNDPETGELGRESVCCPQIPALMAGLTRAPRTS